MKAFFYHLYVKLISMRKAPTWGKTVGIIMIVLGGLGVFIQIYKMILKTFANIQNDVFSNLQHLPDANEPGLRVFDQMFGMTSSQGNIMMIMGLLGLVGCVIYIVGGAKLLKASPQNYNFAKYSLLGFLIYNLICIIWMGMNTHSLMIMGLMVYVVIGFVFDIVLIIILLSNDKSAYGIGEPSASTSIIDSEAIDEFDVE